MTRRVQPDTAEKEARLQAAIAAYRSGEKTVTQAVRHYNVSRSTFYSRLDGILPRNQAHESDQRLTHAEEKELVSWITRLTITGYSPRYKTLREMAEAILKKRIRADEERTENEIHLGNLGEGWIQRFLKRHPELASVRARNIEAARVRDPSPERLKQWFDDLNDTITKFKVRPENIYNMDESGFSIGEVEASRCIIDAYVRQQFQKATPGRQEWVTSVECICTDGTSIPPLIMFKAESLSRAWIPASIHRSWCFSYNSKGYTSNQHGLEWLTCCFDPATKEKAHSGYHALICDGHDSHITGDFVVLYGE